MQCGIVIVQIVYEQMVNKCTVCGRLVAGHTKYGCRAGPGNCTLEPLTPFNSPQGVNSLKMSTSQQNPTSSAPSTPSTAPSSVAPATTQASVPVSTSSLVSSVPTTETPCSSGAPVVSNVQLEAELRKQAEALEKQLAREQAEASASQNVAHLYSYVSGLQQKIDTLQKSRVVPATTVSAPLLTSMNLFAPPASAVSVSGFGSQALTSTVSSAGFPVVSPIINQSAGAAPASFPNPFIPRNPASGNSQSAGVIPASI